MKDEVRSVKQRDASASPCHCEPPKGVKQSRFKSSLLRLRLATVASLFLAMTMMAAPVHASVDDGPLQKAGRGVANLVTGWLELPAQVMRVTEQSGSWSGMTVGLGRGVVLGVGRTLAGALELVTFPIPSPNVGYGPVIQPEYVRFRDADQWE